MRQMSLVFILMFCTLLAHAQTIVGLDMPSLLYSELKTNIGYKIGQHWSLSASAGVNLKALRRQSSSIEIEHYEEFPPNSPPEARDYTHRENFAMCYWPQMAFSGPVISFGGEYRSTSGLDVYVGFGYMFKIWKGLSASIGYDVGIIRTTRQEKLTVEDLSIGINWKF